MHNISFHQIETFNQIWYRCTQTHSVLGASEGVTVCLNSLIIGSNWVTMDLNWGTWLSKSCLWQIQFPVNFSMSLSIWETAFYTDLFDQSHDWPGKNARCGVQWSNGHRIRVWVGSLLCKYTLFHAHIVKLQWVNSRQSKENIAKFPLFFRQIEWIFSKNFMDYFFPRLSWIIALCRFAASLKHGAYHRANNTLRCPCLRNGKKPK